ncbi:hypothetical protein MUN82_06465 [Hymenobacter aerilatus]|uniref:Uncharacterized protein n=1 Tax=Hymenobacter aerilatus TaxID=2932251 RepID=A0A8T9SXB6_9BACT|nr:hypothetical protein [Hymenobacter aerilatus]UOR06738.1 hypothetical protein MUN82_06465 [Hymenobacter aerilatus]
MLTDVQTWLQQPADFAAGAALYAAHGTSSVYRQLFARGETSYSRQLLVRELQALATREADEAPKSPTLEIVVSAPVVPFTAPEPQKSPTPTTSASEESVRKVRAQLKALRDERSQTHAQLTAPRLARKDRLQLALRILDIGDEVLAAEERLAYVQQHGQLPPGPVATADVTDAGELRRRLDNLVALRSKVRKRPDRAVELPQIEADIQLIREKLTAIVRV